MRIKQGGKDLAGLVLILAIYYGLGFAVSKFAGLAISPGVVGAVLLLITLLAMPKLRARYYPATMHLFTHFPLFVLPAAVGIMTAAAYFVEFPLLILWVIAGSTLLSIIFTAFVVRLLIGKAP